MKAKKQALAVIGVAVLMSGMAMVMRQIEHTRKRASRAYGRWHVITVNRNVKDIAMNSPELEPLMGLGNDIEVSIRHAPGDRGTEIAGRLHNSGNDMTDKTAKEMLRNLRAALRDTQWLVETGEILRPEQASTARRTLTSLPLQFAARHAREGGRI